ncbi:hypothetical protein Tco_0248140 [Tanacetum coccineum]
MSDSEDSTVTYTEVSSPFKDLSDIGSPGVVGPEKYEEERSTALRILKAIALPAVDHAPSAEETEPMSIRDEPPMPFWSKAEISRLLAIPSPLPLLLSLWSSPLPQIPSPSLRAMFVRLCLPPRLEAMALPLSGNVGGGESSALTRLRSDEDFRRAHWFSLHPDDEIMRRSRARWALATDETELGRRLIDLVTTMRQDIDEIYGRLDEALI